MRLRNIAFYLLAVVLLSSCATGKNINKASDIQDDGESNVVVITYDITLYATDKFPTEKSTYLGFNCPENSAIARNNCFALTVPYKGKSEYEGYDLHTFKLSGAKVMKMKYNALSVTSGRYQILVDEQKRTKCSYDKKKKKTTCYPVTEKEHDTYNFNLPDAIPLTVTPGSGCYMGHLSLKVVGDNVNEHEFVLDAELTPEKLANLDSGVSSAVQQYVDRPCY